MTALKTILCPKCGAPVELDDGHDSATCTYCGTKSFATSRRASSAAGAVAARGCAGPVLVLVGVIVMLGVVGAVLALKVAAPSPPSPPSTSAPAVAPVPTSSSALAPSPPRVEAPVVAALSSVAPLVSDVDGDQHIELIAGIRSTLGGAATEHFAVFDPRTGVERARTPALADVGRLLAAAHGGRLVLAGENGQLTGYDLVSGDVQWNTTLGDRVTAICESRAADALHVETADQRKMLIDLTTGRQTETREPCTKRLARGGSFEDPRDRRDYAAPAGIDAYRCGGVRVMGGASYTVSDQCRARAHIDTDRLDGMVGHRLWRADGGWLVFGVRQPGAYVPMVGRLGRGSTFVWKSEVPVSNPLEADTGGPRHVVMTGDALLVAYGMRGSPRALLTAFALSDGVRRFTVPLSDSATVDAMVPVGDDAVAVQIDEQLTVHSVADGSVRATIGTAE